MSSPLEGKLIVVTGKGGVGKTTIAAALGLLGAERARDTIVVEVGDQSRLPQLFGHRAQEPGTELRLHQNLTSISIDPDEALLEWLQRLGGRVSGRLLASSGTFQYFAAAAPGAKELVSMVKIWELAQGGHSGRGRDGHELVVLDAPATGHALGMLASPRTFGAIARVGPIARQATRLRELLCDAGATSYLAVAHATEMAVTETLELQEGLRSELGRSLWGVIANGLLPQRFSAGELLRIDQAARAAGGAPDGDAAVIGAAAEAAHTVHRRARFQHNQLARLRRRGFRVVSVPFVWDRGIDLPAVRRIAAQLARHV